MITVLTYLRKMTFVGRNGRGSCSGVEIVASAIRDRVTLAPINGRGQRANAYIQVPVEQIPKLIELLQAYAPPLTAAALKTAPPFLGDPDVQ